MSEKQCILPMLCEIITTDFRCKSSDLPQSTEPTAVAFFKDSNVDKACVFHGSKHIKVAAIITGAVTAVQLRLENIG